MSTIHLDMITSVHATPRANNLKHHLYL